jgi:hypothetical protein
MEVQMKAEIFQRALLATARVACCASLFACQVPTEVKSDTAQPVQQAATQPKTVEECEAHTKDVYISKTTEKSETTTQCCNQIMANINSLEMAAQMTAISQWETRWDCCDLAQNVGGIACTPWGPPCPPAMLGANKKEA